MIFTFVEEKEIFSEISHGTVFEHGIGGWFFGHILPNTSRHYAWSTLVIILTFTLTPTLTFTPHVTSLIDLVTDILWNKNISYAVIFMITGV